MMRFIGLVKTASSPSMPSGRTRFAVLFLSITLFAALALAVPQVATEPYPNPADASFKIMTYNGLGAAVIQTPQCQATHANYVILSATLDVGKVVDTSYQQPPIHCCGGPENHNTATTNVPPGLHVVPSFDHHGEGGVFNLSFSHAETTNASHQKVLLVHLNVGDVYVGPPCGDTLAGPTRTWVQAWVKQRNATPAPAKPIARK